MTDEKGALVSGTNFTFDNVVFHDVRVTDPTVHNECIYAIVRAGHHRPQQPLPRLRDDGPLLHLRDLVVAAAAGLRQA